MQHRALNIAAACLLVGVLCIQTDATAIRRKEIPAETLIQRLQMAATGNQKRHDTLQKLFVDVGCSTTDQKVPHEPPNVICILPGESSDTILVGAHFDKVEYGRGVVDNWSGAALLPSLYEALEVVPRRHTMIFVGFTGEEDGLVGSKYYVRQLANQDKTKIHAMIAMDTLGLGPTEVWTSHADRTLLGHLLAVSTSLHLQVTGMNVDNVGDTDSSPFRNEKIPTITLHSVTRETWHILHSNRDMYQAVDQKAYVDTCHLITDYVAYLDEVLDSSPSVTEKTPNPSIEPSKN